MLTDVEWARARVELLHDAWRKLAQPGLAGGTAQRVPAVRQQWEAWKRWRSELRAGSDWDMRSAPREFERWQKRYAKAHAAAKSAGALAKGAPAPALLKESMPATAPEGARRPWPRRLAENVAWSLTAAGAAALLLPAIKRVFSNRE